MKILNIDVISHIFSGCSCDTQIHTHRGTGFKKTIATEIKLLEQSTLNPNSFVEITMTFHLRSSKQRWFNPRFWGKVKKKCQPVPKSRRNSNHLLPRRGNSMRDRPRKRAGLELQRCSKDNLATLSQIVWGSMQCQSTWKTHVYLCQYFQLTRST